MLCYLIEETKLIAAADEAIDRSHDDDEPEGFDELSDPLEILIAREERALASQV